MAEQATPKPEAWSISFGKPKRRVTKKEAKAIADNNEVKPSENCNVVNVDDFVDEAVAIPRNLPTTREDMASRHQLDLIRLYCMSRPQYKRSCGVSSLTSVWNFLYSRVGHGSLPPVSQEEVMSILGFKPPFDDIRWGPFTGNVTLMRWFHSINQHFGVEGKAYIFWKCHGKGRTIGVSNDQAEDNFKEAIRNPNVALIYHCLNHYMVPIGYQEQPRAQIHAFAPKLSREEYDTQVIIGDPSRGVNPSMHVKKWSDVCIDLNCQSPQFFNIRHTEKGVQTRSKKAQEEPGNEPPPVTTGKRGGNLHCFIAFRKDIVETDMAQFLEGDDDDEEDNPTPKEDEDEDLEDDTNPDDN